MKNVTRVVAIAVLCSCAVLQAESDPHAHKPHWGYSGATGPAHWGQICPEFIMAGIGKNQSPINIAGPSLIEADLPAIQFSYGQVPLQVIHNGHSIEQVCAGGSSIEVDGIRFGLKQFHFNSPSENHIEGVSYPLEAHLVHADKDGNLAVIALMFVEGRHNDFIEKLWTSAPKVAGKTNAPQGVAMNAMDMLPANKDYYRFNGSLTTPLCSEGVRWLVLKAPVELSRAQVKTFQTLIGFANNRPIQATNARPILK